MSCEGDGSWPPAQRGGLSRGPPVSGPLPVQCPLFHESTWHQQWKEQGGPGPWGKPALCAFPSGSRRAHVGGWDRATQQPEGLSVLSLLRKANRALSFHFPSHTRQHQHKRYPPSPPRSPALPPPVALLSSGTAQKHRAVPPLLLIAGKPQHRIPSQTGMQSPDVSESDSFRIT